MANRFIVRVRGATLGKQIAARLHADPAVVVVEETPRMMLVEASESTLRDAIESGPDVLIVPESHYERPDTRPSIVRSPAGPRTPRKLK